MKENDNDYLYQAFKAKDSRFDGRFFVGVSSTMIYCRPICRAKLPKKDNCSYFYSAAQAQSNGYRPCLICRPELAPGNAISDSSVNLAIQASKLLEEHCTDNDRISDIARRLNCSERHLRRVFVNEFKVKPIEYLLTCRLLLAKSLLTNTKLSVIDIAMASGFNSVRRFNDAFKKQYNMSPTKLRKESFINGGKKDTIMLSLGYRPPYKWKEMLEFLSLRAIPKVELIKDGRYYRSVSVLLENGRTISGCICVSNNEKKNILNVEIDYNLLPAISYILARVKHLFDLECNPTIIAEKLDNMNDVYPNSFVLGLRIPGCFDPFEMSVRAIVGQQISVKAASTLIGRIVEKYGNKIDSDISGIEYVFPNAQTIIKIDDIEKELGVLGIIKRRSRTIQALANAFLTNEIDFYYPFSIEKEIEKLLKLPGIGIWSAQYIAMRSMGWTDAFLHTDLGVKKALPNLSEKEILEFANNYRPWRSYVMINLWNYEMREDGKK